jgi:predicted DNA-binding transcriptional regulator AlpA
MNPIGPGSDERRSKYARSRDVLQRFLISRTTLWRLVRNGKFPAPVYMPGGQRRWLLADLERFEAELRGAAVNQ